MVKTANLYFIYLLLLIFSYPSFAEEIPVENFFKFSEIDQLRLSPTGKYLAARVNKDHSSSLFILERETLKLTGQFDFGGEDSQIGSFGWLNDTRVYASMVEKSGPLALPQATGFLFSGNYDGSKKRQLLPQPAGVSFGSGTDRLRGFSIVNNLPEDPENILVSLGGNKLAKIVKLNVYNSRQINFATSPEPYGQLFLDHALNPRIATSFDADKDLISIFHRSPENKKWKKISTFNNTEESFNPIQFTKDNIELLVHISDKKTNGIYRYNPVSNSKQLVMELHGDADIESYMLDDDLNTPGLVGVVRQPNRLVKEYLDLKNNAYIEKEKALDEAFPEQHAEVINTTTDKRYSMVGVISDKRPVSYYLLDNQTFNIELLMHTRPWIRAEDMSSQEPISFTARDGLEIRGYLTRPKGQIKNLPMVLMVHGGPYGPKDDWTFNEEAQFLAYRGYAVLQVNFRGSGGRGLGFQYNAYRQMGAEMQDDLTDATLWAVKQGIADKDRLCIYGGSYGGYASAYAVVKEPDLYKCAIPYAAVFDIEIQNGSDTALFDNGRRFLDEAWNINDKNFVVERSPIHHLKKLKAALFLIHGEADQRVPFEQYTAMAEALDKLGYPYESMTKSHEPHGFATEKNRIEMHVRLADFLDKHIGEKSK